MKHGGAGGGQRSSGSRRPEWSLNGGLLMGSCYVTHKTGGAESCVVLEWSREQCSPLGGAESSTCSPDLFLCCIQGIG